MSKKPRRPAPAAASPMALGGRSAATPEQRAVALARQQARDGRGPDAIATLRALVAKQPDAQDAQILLGTLEGMAGDCDAAERRLRAALAHDARSVVARNSLGVVLAATGRPAEALDCFERVLAVQPGHAGALMNRAKLLQQAGRAEEALEAYERVLALDGTHRQALVGRGAVLTEMTRRPGAAPGLRERAIEAFRLAKLHGASGDMMDYSIAALGGGSVPQASPRAYVKTVFDAYADRFDSHLQHLGYRAPEQLVEDLARYTRREGLHAVDLGCGTGLCGVLLRPMCAYLAGVDLSEGMLQKARERGCYDDLCSDDLVEYLAARPDRFDLAVATDVLIYVGDLAPFMAAARRALGVGGVLAFSVEAWTDDAAEPDAVITAGYRLQPTLRYMHHRAYVRAAASAQGLHVESERSCTLRTNRDADVPGLLFVLRRGADA